ncbi:hypothetical protein FHS38_000394 [Streptomyces netropsis]|uniref:Uncharacterized protein n=1 Tax=Streptomyces netropsis TaxID=55404 RepID=A0A7W7L669_STRNE|nr:hypothetical protein [Streptomyces netropsis]GGR04071.1 hypothetical protein GCM10010219_05290 [Streptomyces netropsis]
MSERSSEVHCCTPNGTHQLTLIRPALRTGKPCSSRREKRLNTLDMDQADALAAQKNWPLFP